MRVHRVPPGRALPLLAFFAAASLGVAGAQSVSPTDRPSTLPGARQVIDRHIEAVGGRTAILAHTSTTLTGTVSIPSTGLSGTIQVFAAKPDRQVMKMSVGGVGELQEGFDGKNGWSMSPMTGPSLLEGKELEQKRFEADYYAELRSEQRYASMVTLERTTFDGRPCYKLRLTRKDGAEDLEFYDVETGLKAGSIVTRETPMGSVSATTVESDYRRFGKLLQPTTLRVTAMGVQQIISVSTLEFDTVNPAVFEPPGAIKALLK